MPNSPAPDGRGSRAPRSRISWPAVVGFGLLGLLWPLLRMIGTEAALGQIGTALLALAITGAVWVLGAGFGRVPLPIATLAMSGALSGALLAGASAAAGDWPDYGIGLALTAAMIEIARSGGFGALAGLVAGMIQRSRRGTGA